MSTQQDHDDAAAAVSDIATRALDVTAAVSRDYAALTRELGRTREVLAPVPDLLRTAHEDSVATRALLLELRDRRAAEREHELVAARRAGREEGKAEADRAHAASVPGAVRGSLVAVIGSDRGRMALGAILIAAAWAAIHLLAPPLADLDLLRPTP
jgi:hypothetical protein